MSVLNYHFGVGIYSDVREVRYEGCVTDLRGALRHKSPYMPYFKNQ